MMIIKRFFSIAAIFMALSVFLSCNGDMHDEDESLRSYIVMSLEDKTLSIPKDSSFAEDFEAYNVEGTYGEYSFSNIKITTDGFYTSTIELFDANKVSIYKETKGSIIFTLDYDMKIKLNDNSIFPLDKWNNVKYK